MLQDFFKTDIYESGENVLINIEAAGFDKKDLDISIKNNKLYISGKSSIKKEGEKVFSNYSYSEERDINKYFSLNEKIDKEKIKADYNNGILSIVLPKKEKETDKKILIN